MERKEPHPSPSVFAMATSDESRERGKFRGLVHVPGLLRSGQNPLIALQNHFS